MTESDGLIDPLEVVAFWLIVLAITTIVCLSIVWVTP